MLQATLNAFRIADLRRKILFTIGILILVRFIAHVPVPGINLSELAKVIEGNQALGILNVFSGGTLSQFSVIAMGVYPYITASIVMQLLIGIIPRLTELSKEGESGRAQINRITHYVSVPLAALEAYGLLRQFSNGAALGASTSLLNFKFGLLDGNADRLFSWAVLVAMVAGTILLVWMGELITEYGIGQGVSIIIFGGIVAGLPNKIGQLFNSTAGVGNFIGFIIFILIGIATIIGIVLIQEGQRRIPVNYARTMMRGGRITRQSGSSFIPMRVNSAGMIPLIFAIAIMLFPSTIAGFFLGAQSQGIRDFATGVRDFFSPQTLQYQILYFVMVVAFAFFYTLVQFQQQQIAENLQKSGGSIPGVRPGAATDRYLQRVLFRITLLGALFLGLVAVLPYLGAIATGSAGTQNLITSTSLLIVVGVAIDTMKQLEAQLLMRQYEGFIKN